MRQAAWLYTVPEKAKEPRHKSRISAYPPVRGGQHILELLFEVGPTQVAGMGGLVAISELDVLAWQVNRGIGLSGWEVEMTRRLSAVYASQAMEARSPLCPPPYSPPRERISEEQKERISKEMESWADRLERQLSTRRSQ